MRALMRNLRPEEFEHLIALNALYRPGPLGAGMHTEYADRKNGRSDVAYLHPSLEPILKDSFGIMVYQEQVMQAAREMAGFSMRATLIHVAALFGTAMAANVWMRIWPAQRRIITATKNGEAPDAADPALAGLRSKHNTYMSVPLLLFMVSVHQDAILRYSEGAQPYIVIAAVLGIGFVFTYAIYAKAKNVPGF